MRYIINKVYRWQNDSEVFKILDTHTGRLSYSSYNTYETAKQVVLKKNNIRKVDKTNSTNKINVGQFEAVQGNAEQCGAKGYQAVRSDVERPQAASSVK